VVVLGLAFGFALRDLTVALRGVTSGLKSLWRSPRLLQVVRSLSLVPGVDLGPKTVDLGLGFVALGFCSLLGRQSPVGDGGPLPDLSLLIRGPGLVLSSGRVVYRGGLGCCLLADVLGGIHETRA
jgi:hypothetical protein